MRIETPSERRERQREALEKLRRLKEDAAATRALLTGDDLARAEGRRHQGARERARRLRRNPRNT